MLKNDLVQFYKDLVEQNNITYKELSNLAGLSQSQIANILKNDAKMVSVEKMEAGLNRMGFGLQTTPYNLGEQ